MPNWVQINLTFSGDKAEIKQMLEAIKNNDIGYGSIDFNKIIPMPEQLNIESGSKSIHGMEMVKEYLESMPEELKNKEGTYEEFFDNLRKHRDDLNDDEKEIWDIGVIAVDNLHKYGAPTWREWAYKNWGTKWNAYDFDEMSEENNTIYFQTAWYAPVPAILNLSQKYPNIEMSMRYADEDLGHNCGTVEFKNGSITQEKYPQTRKEALEFSAEMWDTELDSYSLHINQTGTDYVSTWKKDFELVELFGKPALFTNKRLNPEDVPLGLNLYHFRHNDEGEITAIEPNVKVNNAGSVLTNETIDFGKNGYIEFTEDNSPNFIGVEDLSIDDYITENFSMDESEEQAGGMNLCQ